MAPLLYFSYGMTKTGSTLAFELAHSALDLCGYPQDRVAKSGIVPGMRLNFVNTLSQAELAGLSAHAKKAGYPLALKTHARPPQGLAAMIRRGEAMAQISYRDPRDMALSMLDHGVRARAEGRHSFSELETLAQTLENIRGQFETLSHWLRLPGALPLYFEDVAFNTENTAQRILNRLELDLDAAMLAEVVHSQRFTQKNKARARRYPNEMKAANARAIAQEFAPFISRFIEHRQTLPADGRPLLAPNEPLLHSAGQMPANQRI